MAKRPDQSWRDFVLNSLLPKMEATSTAATNFEPAPANPQPFSAGVYLQPQYDVIELLPEERKDLLRKQRERPAEKHAVIVPFSDLQELNAERQAAAAAARQLVDHPQDFGRGLAETDPTVVAARKNADRLATAYDRLNERRKYQEEAWLAASAPLQAVETYLRSGIPAGYSLAPAVEVSPKLLKGEASPLDGVARLQRRGREINAVIHSIRSSPFPKDYCKRRLREMVDPLAQRGPDVSTLVELDRDIVWPTTLVQAEVHAERRSVAFHEAVDVLGLFAWMFKDQLIAALERLIDDESDDAASLSYEERQRREAEALGDLLAVERDECALVWLAQSQGLPVEFRPDCSPLAILQVRLVTTPHANPSPGTSPEHAFDVMHGRR